MGRESPNFLMTGDGLHPLPDLSSFNMNPFPLATGPDPIVAARLQGFAAGVPHNLHPLFAMHNTGPNLHQLQAVQYMQGKLSVGLFPGYIPHPNGVPHPIGLSGHSALMNPAFMTHSSPQASLPVSPPQPTSVPMRFQADTSPETLDLRKSSIDNLRLKAQEHSTTTQEPERESPRISYPDVKVA